MKSTKSNSTLLRILAPNRIILVLCVCILILVAKNNVLGQCPMLTTDEASFCDLVTVETVTFRIDEDANDCFDANQGGSNTLEFDITGTGFQFINGTALVFFDPSGDLVDVNPPIISNTNSLITISNLTTNNGGAGRDAIDFIEVIVQVQAVTLGSTGIIRRSGGSFSINGSPAIPALGEALVTLNSNAQTLSTTGNAIQNADQMSLGGEDQVVLEIPIEMSGAACPWRFTEINLDYIGDDPSDIGRVALYYTGTSSVFNTSNVFAEEFVPGASTTLNGGVFLGHGTNYFWLVVDLSASATVGNRVDYEIPDYSLDDDGVVNTYTNGGDFDGSPAGDREIVPFAGQTHTVGVSGTYNTIQLAYDNIPNNPTEAYLIEILGDYDPNMESFPLMFGNKNTTSNNSITIRPELGVSGMEVTGDPGAGTVGMIQYNSASHVLWDGRPGGVGTDRELTIRNERIAGGRGAVFTLTNDASFNEFKYLFIESETNAATSGMVDILNAGTVGNDFNVFDNCYFSDISSGGSANRPGVGIYSNDGSGNGNNNIEVSNCEFVDVWNAGSVNSWAVQLFGSGSNWMISNNHFYENQSFAGVGFNSGFAFMNAGTGHVIENNYIGGQDVFAGGGKMDVPSGVDPMDVIYFGPGITGGVCTIRGNTLGNLRLTNTHSTASQFPFSGIYCDGSAEYIIENNSIGNPAIPKDLEVINNGTSGEMFVGIFTGSNTGDCHIVGNFIGGVFIDGSLNNTNVNMIDTRSASGDVTILGNAIGGPVASSIEIKPDVVFRAIDNSAVGKIVVEGNSITNVDQQGVGGNVSLINNIDGTSFTAEDNTISNIDLSLDGTIRFIASINATTEVNISNNSISAVGQTGTGAATSVSLIYANSGVFVKVDSNTIGGSLADDISCDAGNDIRAIEKQGAATTFLAQGNTIQNITSSASNANINVIGIQNNGANSVLTVTDNLIADIEANSSNSTSPALVGIDANNSGVGHLISNNTIRGLVLDNPGSNDALVVAIEVGGGSGDVSANFIEQIENSGTGTTDACLGIFANGSGTWKVFNNVVFIENTAYATNIDIDGIRYSGTTIGQVYHNAVFVEGNSGGGLDATSGFADQTSGILTVTNNAFVNLRTGGVGNYAVRTNGGTFGNNFNYLEVAEDQNKVGFNGSALGFVNWQTATSSFNSLNGIGEVFNAQGAFTTSFVGMDAGTDLTGIVNDDYNGEVRDANPWIGAYEGDGVPFVFTLPNEPGSGYSLSLDGDDYVIMGAPVTTQVNDVTIEAWFNWDGTISGSDQMIIMNGNNGASGYGLYLQSGTNEIAARLGGVGPWSSTVVAESDQWTHVALVGTPSNSWQIFINGVPRGAPLSSTANTPNTNFTIGANHVGSFDFNGELDEIRVWNKALTQLQIRDWMCQKIKTSHSEFASLSNLWVMDEGAGGTLIDYVGTSDGNLTGSAPVADWVYSGAYIGDSSVHNYINTSDVVLMSPLGGSLTLENLDGNADSVHVYYVAEPANDLTSPVGIDSLDEVNYWGIFYAGNDDPALELNLDYTLHPDIDGYVYEADIKLAGRQSNASLGAWNLPSNPSAISVNTTSNVLSVDTIDGSVEVVVAYAQPPCDTTSSTSGTWTWDGTVSNDWFDCANWDMGSLPNSQVDVLIPGGTTFNPEISVLTGYCQSIDIDSDNAAVLNLDSDSGGRLEIGP